MRRCRSDTQRIRRIVQIDVTNVTTAISGKGEANEQRSNREQQQHAGDGSRTPESQTEGCQEGPSSSVWATCVRLVEGISRLRPLWPVDFCCIISYSVSQLPLI